MTHDQFASTVVAWLRDDAESAVADHLGAVLDQTRRTRQRPWWSSLERWLPVQTTMRLAAAPRLAWLLMVLALILAIAVAAIVVGSRAPVLEPFGLAANGIVIYGDGDISAIDPATGKSTAIVTGSSYDAQPLFSRDGSMFVFSRATGSARLVELLLAKADGTVVRTLTAPITLEWVDWSPDGRQVVVADSSPTAFSIVAVDGSGTRDISLDGLQAKQVFWRPSGDLVFRGSTSPADEGPYSLYLVGADGTGLREIPPSYHVHHDYQEPALSPDGSRVIYTEWGDGGGHLYVLDVAGGEAVGLSFEDGGWSDYFATWSPDGGSIVFNRGRAQDTYHIAVAPSGGGPVVDLGPDMPWEAGAIAAFSPDGSKVIARYGDGSTWLFDVTGGPGQPLEVSTPALMTWQRVTP